MTMICPECQGEYRDGFYRCADCDVDLVPTPEAPPGEEYPPVPAGVVLQPAFRTTNPAHLPLARSILESASIPYSVFGEEILVTMPPAGVFEAKIMVPEDRAEEARELLQDIRIRVEEGQELPDDGESADEPTADRRFDPPGSPSSR